MLSPEIFAYVIPAIYTAFYLGAAISCLYKKSRSSIILFIFLTLLFSVAWVESLWESPINLMMAHFLIFVGMIFALEGRSAPYFASLTLAMVVVGGYFVLTEYAETWRFRSINILFACQCVIAMAVRWYTTHKIKDGDSHAKPFYAMEAMSQKTHEVAP